MDNGPLISIAELIIRIKFMDHSYSNENPELSYVAGRVSTPARELIPGRSQAGNEDVL
jgi:hypothetical protein